MKRPFIMSKKELKNMYYNYMGEKIFYVDTAKRSDFLTVTLAGITYPNEKYLIIHNSSAYNMYDNYVFEYVVSGTGYLETDGKRTVLQAGDSYFLNKLKYHIYYSDKADPFKKMFVVVNGTFIDSLLNAFRIKEDFIVKKIDTSDIIGEIHRILDSAQKPTDEVQVLLFRLVQRLASPIPDRDNSEIGLAQLVMSYFDRNITEHITLETLSKALHFSKSHIEKVFRQHYGKSPLKYFTERKIKYACQLLVSTDYSVSYIAEYLSFTSAKYFSKCLKAQTGKTPLEYRKTSRLGDAAPQN